jgi:hypothetical protein
MKRTRTVVPSVSTTSLAVFHFGGGGSEASEVGMFSFVLGPLFVKNYVLPTKN